MHWYASGDLRRSFLSEAWKYLRVSEGVIFVVKEIT